MKRILSVFFILLFSGTMIFAQSARYENLVEKGREFESEKKWIHALGMYYDAMVEEPTQKSKTAYEAFLNLSSEIKSGKPGYGTFDEFDSYDGWKSLAAEYEEFWTENCPHYFTAGEITKGELDVATRTGSYKLSVRMDISEKYVEIQSVVLEGYKKAWKDYWTDCYPDILPISDDPGEREYALTVHVIGRDGKELLDFGEQIGDEVFEWDVHRVPRNIIKKMDSEGNHIAVKRLFWVEGKKRTEANLDGVKLYEGGEEPPASYITKVGIKDMILVEGGTFKMGSVTGDLDEKPVHEVTVSSFLIGKYEVTQAQWMAVMGNNPSKNQGERLPVENITWYDAIEYCNKLSEAEGLEKCYAGKKKSIRCDFTKNGYRLPTEAEWEYAARGGKKSTGRVLSGADEANADDVAWYYSNSKRMTHEVGTKKPNELEIFDMSGNVWEWCWDRYSKDYYKDSPDFNPTGSQSNIASVVNRGGGCKSFDYVCSSTRRNSDFASAKNGTLGFRLARTVVDK